MNTCFCYETQGTICQETGAYLLNFAGCKACGKKEPLTVTDKLTQEDEDEELVIYKRKLGCNFDIVLKTKRGSMIENSQ